MTEIKYYNNKKESTDNYMNYVNEHISNVRRAFNELKDKFILLINNKIVDNVNIDSLEGKISEHDESKYQTVEFDGYRQWFYPVKGEKRSKQEFDKAWNHHKSVNSHHPEYWEVKDPRDYNTMVLMQIPDECLLEMICDWQAMSYKFGGNPKEYYYKTGKNLKFNDQTRKKLEKILALLFEF